MQPGLTRRGLMRRAVLGAAGLVVPGDGRVVVSRGMLAFGGVRVRCAVGRSGVRAGKREGDGATPAGVFALREVLYRADRGPAPATRLPVSAIGRADGWSDDPADPAYNQRRTAPSGYHQEPLWRQDGLYDVFAVIGSNDEPVVAGAGSAIFLHIARADFGPTDGCVAVARGVLLRVLAGCGIATEIGISG